MRMKKLVLPLQGYQNHRNRRNDSANLYYDQLFVSATICTSFFYLVDVRYATALRLLRPYCYTLYIRPPATSCLIPRLQKICELENIKADARALTLLADSHEGDLRSCLNSLQLFATRCKNLTLPIVQKSLERAKKEGSLSAHSVVERIFAKRTAKDRRRLNVATEIEGHRVVDNVVACGEFDRIISGIS